MVCNPWRVCAYITQAKNRLGEGKRWLAHAKKRHKPKPEEVAEIKASMGKLKTLLDGAVRPKTNLQAAVKEVKRLENAVKQARAAVERSGKVISASYTALKALKN